MRTPYLEGSVAFGSNFYGRASLMADLLDSRRTRIHLVGNRRSGKTSVLYRLEEQTEAVPLFINLQSTGKQCVDLGLRLVQQIDDCQTRFPALKRVKRKPLSDVCGIINSLASVAGQHKLAVLMLWDEGEKLLEMDPVDLLCLRAALEGKPHLRTILAATTRLNRLKESHTGDTSPFMNGFAPVYLSPLSELEAIDLIVQPRNEEGAVFVTDTLLRQILELTGGQPYLIQLLCNRLFETSGRLRPIEDSDLVVNEALSHVFQTDYDGLLFNERVVLKALADSSGTSEDLSRRLSLPVGIVSATLYSLHSLGLIRSTAGRYELASFFLQNWLVTGRMQEPGDDPRSVSLNRLALRRQIDQARANLRLIEERISEYVQSVEIPLQLIKDQRRLKDLIAELDQRLNES